jgi:hypothetical protein
MQANGVNAAFRSAAYLTVGEIRGKAWVFGGIGVNFGNTYVMNGVDGNDGISDSDYIYLQNLYQMYTWTVSKKVDKVKNTAFNVGCNDVRMKVNFLSGSGGVQPYWLAKWDGQPNQVMDMALRQVQKRCLGVNLMDYPGTALIRGIINSNFG